MPMPKMTAAMREAESRQKDHYRSLSRDTEIIATTAHACLQQMSKRTMGGAGRSLECAFAVSGTASSVAKDAGEDEQGRMHKRARRRRLIRTRSIACRAYPVISGTCLMQAATRLQSRNHAPAPFEEPTILPALPCRGAASLFHVLGIM